MLIKEKAIKRVMEMYDNQGRNHLHERLNRLLNSGYVYLDDYEDNYLLPKILLSALLDELSWQYLPFIKEYREEVKRLREIL